MQYIYLEICSLFEAEQWVIIIIIIIIILISGHFALPFLFICFNIYSSVWRKLFVVRFLLVLV